MKIGLKDTLSFGKFKNKTIGSIIADGQVSYLCWLQEQWLTSPGLHSFDSEVLDCMCQLIQQDKKLLKKYGGLIGKVTAASVSTHPKSGGAEGFVAAAKSIIAKVDVPATPDPVSAGYGQEWGAW